MLLQILFVWLAVGTLAFCVLAALTPNNDLNRASPEWTAVLAFLWPLLLLYFLVGWIIALVEILVRNRDA